MIKNSNEFVVSVFMHKMNKFNCLPFNFSTMVYHP